MDNITINETPEIEESILRHKKKKKTVILSCAGAFAVIALVLVLVNFDYIENFARKTFSDSTSYAKWVTGKSVSSFSDGITTGYNGLRLADTLMDSDDTSHGYKLVLNAELGSVLSQNAVIGDLEVTQAGLEAAIMPGDTVGVDLLLSLNGGTLGEIEIIANTLNNLGYVRIPDLSPAYIETEAYYSSSEPAAQANNTAAVIDAFLNSSITSAKDLNSLLTYYNDFIIDRSGEVSLTDTTVTIDGTASKATGIVISLDHAAAVSIFEALSQEIENDEKIYNILQKAAEEDSSINADQALSDISEFVDSIAYDLGNSTFDEMIITLKVDSRGQHCATDIDVITGSETVSISCSPSDNQSGTDIIITQNGTVACSIINKITEESGGAITGSTTVSFNKELLGISMADDANGLLDLSGDEVTLTYEYTGFSYDLSTLSGSGKIVMKTSIIPGGALTLTLSGSADAMDMSMKVTYAGAHIGTLDMGIEKIDYVAPKLPDSSDTVYTEENISEYMSNSDLLNFLSSIYENTGLDLATPLFKFLSVY